MNKGKILVVDDDAFFRKVFTDHLSSAGYNVTGVSSGAVALNIVENEPVDLVITDIVMPEMSGVDLLHKIKQHNSLIDVIVVTGHGTIESAIETLKSGAFDYLRKPVNEIELLHTVERCMEMKKILEENQGMKQSLKLHEASRVITATLDVMKLYDAAIDVFMQSVASGAGLVIVYEPGIKRFDIKTMRHLNIDAAETLAGAFMAVREKLVREAGHVNAMPLAELEGIGFEALEGYSHLLIAPFLRTYEACGFMALLNRAGWDAGDMASATFIAEHAAQAFENARHFSDAKQTAFIDSLTGLYNAKYLETAIDREVKRADRLLSPLTVLFLDIDDFKNVNDSNDHLAGSRVLIEVGKLILKCVREVDTVIRYGGDEYVVILVDADFNVAERIAERIRSSTEKQRFLEDEGSDIRLTVSIGLAAYPVHTRDKLEIIKIADQAMYRAKNASKNAVFLAPVPPAA
ncbi:MAG: diguanylate cyclase [Deltaproteobacteria bacterium]|nr:diguanylate cyclase [Deltaproteobacteria bacterium]